MLNNDQRKRLEAKSGIGKFVKFKDKKTRKTTLMGVVRDEVYILVGDYKHLIQRIEKDAGYWDGSKFGYRTGYYTYDKGGKRILWGQYTQFLTEREYRTLLNKAEAKGWLSS